MGNKLTSLKLVKVLWGWRMLKEDPEGLSIQGRRRLDRGVQEENAEARDMGGMIDS